MCFLHLYYSYTVLQEILVHYDAEILTLKASVERSESERKIERDTLMAKIDEVRITEANASENVR